MRKPKMLEQFSMARQTSTPLVAIQTPDPPATIATIKTMLTKDDDEFSKLRPEEQIEQITKGQAATPPIIQWDVCEGWTKINAQGDLARNYVGQLMKADIKSATLNPVEQLMAARYLPPDAILFVHNAQRYMSGATDGANGFIQGVCNLRDEFKKDGRTLVLLGPSFELPAELSNDVLVLTEPLPSDSQIETIVDEIFDAAGAEAKCSPPVVDAVRGLPAFAIEQVVSMALELDSNDKAILNLDELWERKRKAIEQKRGLAVWREGQKFVDTRGIDGAVEFYREYINGEFPPNLIVFLDEIDKKGIVGGLGSTSGTSSDQLGVILTQMQDNGWTGGMLYGHPGTGKTLLAKTLGNEAGVPTIYMDLDEMQDKFIGESGRITREAFDIIKSMGGDRVLFIATCNEYAPIKPELKRRFGLPTFFFDLMSQDARRAAWQMFCKKFGFEKVPVVINDAGWTGAEIERCVRLAKQLRTTPDKTARYIVPVSQSSGDDITRRRREADGRLLDAATGTLFRMGTGSENGDSTKSATRKMQLKAREN